MKKDKKATEDKAGAPWHQLPTSYKNIVIYFILIILFAAAVFILIHRKMHKSAEAEEFMIPTSTLTCPPPPLPVGEVTPPSPVEPSLSPLENMIAAQNARLDSLGNTVKTLGLNAQISHRFIAYEILNEILEGHLPLETLTLYLKKHPEPWTTEILVTLAPLKGVKTYDELQRLLILPPEPQSLAKSLWQRVKNIVRSIVKIRKLNHGYLATLSDVQTALRGHNIHQALEIFYTLPPIRQIPYASWKGDALDRATLETLKQKMLLAISEN